MQISVRNTKELEEKHCATVRLVRLNHNSALQKFGSVEI